MSLTEIKTLDNSLLQKYDVKLYGSDKDTYNIINDFLEDNQSERAFYIIDLGSLTNSYSNWLRLLPNVKPYYAVKCNPNPVILESLASLGCNFDCASENEMKMVIEITKDPSRIIFANPCKMSSQIRYARANDVDLMKMVNDNKEEIMKDTISSEVKVDEIPVQVLVREDVKINKQEITIALIKD